MVSAISSDAVYQIRAQISKLLWSPGIDSKEPNPPAYVAWRARLNDNPIPARFPAPIDFLKIPALAGRYDNPIPARFLAPMDCLKTLDYFLLFGLRCLGVNFIQLAYSAIFYEE
jgi:hypothetical protein